MLTRRMGNIAERDEAVKKRGVDCVLKYEHRVPIPCRTSDIGKTIPAEIQSPKSTQSLWIYVSFQSSAHFECLPSSEFLKNN